MIHLIKIDPVAPLTVITFPLKIVLFVAFEVA